MTEALICVGLAAFGGWIFGVLSQPRQPARPPERARPFRSPPAVDAVVVLRGLTVDAAAAGGTAVRGVDGHVGG